MHRACWDAVALVRPLLILMTMLLSSCSRFGRLGWFGWMSAKAFFSEGYFELAVPLRLA